MSELRKDEGRLDSAAEKKQKRWSDLIGWLKLLTMLFLAQSTIVAVSLLRANFADVTSFTLSSLLNPIFWLKNPILLLILGLCGSWFMLTILASGISSSITQTRLTASLYTITSTLLSSIFTLIQFTAFHFIRKEAMTQRMWFWVSMAAVCVIIACASYYMAFIHAIGSAKGWSFITSTTL